MKIAPIPWSRNQSRRHARRPGLLPGSSGRDAPGTRSRPRACRRLPCGRRSRWRQPQCRARRSAKRAPRRSGRARARPAGSRRRRRSAPRPARRTPQSGCRPRSRAPGRCDRPPRPRSARSAEPSRARSTCRDTIRSGARTRLEPMARPFTAEDFAARIERAGRAAQEAGLSGVLVTPGPDLLYFTGYAPTAITERLTMLVVAPDREPAMIVPTLERPDAEAALGSSSVELSDWADGSDPTKRPRRSSTRGAATRSRTPPGRCTCSGSRPPSRRPPTSR